MNKAIKAFLTLAGDGTSLGQMFAGIILNDFVYGISGKEHWRDVLEMDDEVYNKYCEFVDENLSECSLQKMSNYMNTPLADLVGKDNYYVQED